MDTPVSFEGVTTFLAVAETLSFTKAATRLGIAKSAASRRVADLEDALGVRLLHRTTRKLHLTDAGAEYAAQARRAVGVLNDANEAVRDRGDAARGRVRITAPADLGATYLPSVLQSFRRKYPEISIDAVLASRRVDLVAEGIDLALRFGALEDSSLVARKIATAASYFVASPAYVARRGVPATLADLAAHDVVLFRAPRGTLRVELESCDRRGQTEAVELRAMLTGDDLSFVHRAALDGAGLALLPWFLVAPYVESGRLVQVLPRYRARGADGHLVYPSSRLLSKRVALLIEHLLAELKALRAEPSDRAPRANANAKAKS
ncbi:MAG: LysR family transcriptional regulator [Myxococcales bacterium]|nr:LysR family transcriptional regulator [Myxococcales bacterium]